MKRIEKIEATKKVEHPSKPESKKRIAVYVRVSTFHEAQLHSLEAQTDFFKQYIRERKNWSLVGIYADNGVSGGSVRNRQKFQMMINDCMMGKIDIIITKSITRFARNTVDTLNTLKQLKKLGIGVFFHKENVWSLDPNGEFLITLLASFAQEESHSISENVKWGIRKGFEEGIFRMPYEIFLGYDKGMVINQQEALIVRRIYRMCLQGYTVYGIAKHLTDNSVPTPASKSKWHWTSIKSILTNEKYKGDALLQKRYTVDFTTHENVKNTGELPQYYIHENHEPIIAPNVFDIVQEKLKKPIFSHKSPLSGKIKCGRCRQYYSRVIWHSTTYNDAVWRCYSYNSDYCGNIHLYEKSLYHAVLKVWKHLLRTDNTAISVCNEIVSELSEETFDARKLIASLKLMDFDDLLLIIKNITVTKKGMLVFHFIDNSRYSIRYQHEPRR